MHTTEAQINQLIEALAAQLRCVCERTYDRFAKCSKIVAELEKLGVNHNTAYDRADLINGVADRDTFGLD